MKRVLWPAAIAAALVSVATAAAAPVPGGTGPAVQQLDTTPLNWGVADDASKYAGDGGAWFYGELTGAGLTENRWTLAWDPANPTQIDELSLLEQAAPKAQAAGIHVVLSLYGEDPKSHDPIAFCTWAALVATTVQAWGIHDFIVWNEPNGPLYWQPQKSESGRDLAAAPYEALLATCYDALHAADPKANVIGMGLAPRASSRKHANEPLTFLRDVGAAYRASGRTTPIMDQLALHPYPNPGSRLKGSPPTSGYANPDEFGIPDLDRVKQAVYDAFAGTGQPTTLDGLTFRLDEVGWQTDTSEYAQYFGAESARPPGAPWPVSEQQQAGYLATMITRYFACDPTVTDVELFLLVDEKYRNGHDETGAYVGGGWQSGLLTAGGEGVSTPKLAYGLGYLFAEGREACLQDAVVWTPRVLAKESDGRTAAAAKRAASIRACNAKFKHDAKKRRACVAAAKRRYPLQ